MLDVKDPCVTETVLMLSAGTVAARDSAKSDVAFGLKRFGRVISTGWTSFLRDDHPRAALGEMPEPNGEGFFQADAAV